MGFYYSQFFGTPSIPTTTDFTGQTIIVTGSNVGLGREAVRHFVHLNANKVILAVRNVEAGKEAASSIETALSRPGVCEVWSLDLASYASVQSFASRVTKTLPRLDVLLCNAGIAAMTFRIFEEDEATITVNVVSTFLLSLLLLPKLQESATRYNTSPRLVIVSSEVHSYATFPQRHTPSPTDPIFPLLSSEEKSKPTFRERYPLSKLLEVLTVRQLAPLISQSTNSKAVILNILNPGLCHSSLSREVHSIKFHLMKLLLARSTEQGSRTLVLAAAAGRESHGKYMTDGKANDGALAAWIKTDEGRETEERIWAELKDKLERISPGILKALD